MSEMFIYIYTKIYILVSAIFICISAIMFTSIINLTSINQSCNLVLVAASGNRLGSQSFAHARTETFYGAIPEPNIKLYVIAILYAH